MVASKLFDFSITNWFSFKVEQSLEQSLQVARDYYSQMEKSSVHSAKMIEKTIIGKELYLVENRGLLEDAVYTKVAEYGLGGVIIYDNKMKHITSIFHKALPASYTSLDFSDLVNQGKITKEASEIQSTIKGDFLVVALPLFQKPIK